MKKYLWLRFLIVVGLPLSILIFTCCSSPKKEVKITSKSAPITEKGFNISNDGQAFRIAFYNVENLFDIEDDPIKIDSEYLPTSRLKWTQERYEAKQLNLAKVVEAMQFPSLLGVTEIENDKVLEDFANQSVMKSSDYKFVHFESPDERGIDVALFYKTADFTVKNSAYIRIKMPNSSDKTRDILQVTGLLKGQPLTVFVNHFPSRRGDKGDSEDKRIYVAEQLRKAVDAVFKKDKNMGVVVMGDFNDAPSDISMSQTLQAQEWTQSATTETPVLYNLAAPIDINTEGSIYYKGWSVFDQIIVSNNLVDKTDKKETIFKQDFMTYKDKSGNQLPNRTYTGPIYRGGYSDHFPVFINIYLK
jgi:predicted extracellular nuclease